MILAILVSIQHSPVPTFNLAENSYFGLAAGKGADMDMVQGKITSARHYYVVCDCYIYGWRLHTPTPQNVERNILEYVDRLRYNR